MVRQDKQFLPHKREFKNKREMKLAQYISRKYEILNFYMQNIIYNTDDQGQPFTQLSQR